MTLEYTDRRVRHEAVKVTVEAPTEWGMFSPAGNRRLTGYAETAIRKLEKADDSASIVTVQVESFYAKVKKLYGDERFSEAGDTAVRGRVRDFGEELFRAAGYDKFAARDREEIAWEGR